MSGRASAFAVLGLEPGADRPAIDQAYRRLIKQYHPDREGGDGVRAAEIIHAYRELRGGTALADPLQFNEDWFLPRRRRYWPVVLMLLLLTAATAILAMRPDMLSDLPAPAKAIHVLRRSPRAHEVMNEPLHESAISAAVLQARTMYRTGDELALAAESRDCRQRFHDRPAVELLDRCSAFDNAVIGLEDRDPLRDGGPFAPLAVTGRQWSAATELSDDYVAIDSRLDRIRLEVELALAAAQPAGQNHPVAADRATAERSRPKKQAPGP